MDVAREPGALTALTLNGRGLHLSAPDAAVEVLGERITAERPIGVGGARLLPCALPGLRGLLRLARADVFALEPGRQDLVGRSDPDAAAARPAITLDQLAQPGSLLWEGIDPGHTLGNLGLSRRHARVWVEDGALLADRATPNAGLLHLDAHLQPLPEAGAGTPREGEPLRLAAGDYLLVGLFLLRYRADDGSALGA